MTARVLFIGLGPMLADAFLKLRDAGYRRGSAVLIGTTMIYAAPDRPDAEIVPIIALTANAFDEDVQRGTQGGLNAHLSKPVEPEVLFKTLEGLIRP